MNCKFRAALPFSLLFVLYANGQETKTSLMGHLGSSAGLGELRNLRASWNDGRLKLSINQAHGLAWAVIPRPEGGFDLARRATVNSEIVNTGDEPVHVMLWIVGDHGWSAVGDAAILEPHERRTFSCNLRDAYPDGTPKLNPSDVKLLQVMLKPVPAKAKTEDNGKPLSSPRINGAISVEMSELTAKGDAPQWKRPFGRIDVPIVEDSAPAPGKRVRYRLEGNEQSTIYSVLNLPEDWQPGKKYPVLVEYPGNIFYTPACYSTGLPDQCVIGYGMTKGKGAIALGMPFVDSTARKIAENGWGNAEDTANYAMRMVDEVCAKFGGDRGNLVLTGFSRGAIACGYIGLRDDNIAALWKGFHACQHYDGDGWNGTHMKDALVRARRFRGKAFFNTDNPESKMAQLIGAMRCAPTFVKSGLGAHSTAMFLDDRPSTQRLRDWFWQLVGSPQK